MSNLIESDHEQFMRTGKIKMTDKPAYTKEQYIEWLENLIMFPPFDYIKEGQVHKVVLPILKDFLAYLTTQSATGSDEPKDEVLEEFLEGDKFFQFGKKLAIPAGWKLVPIEPTKEMINMAVEEFKKDGMYSEGGGTYKVSYKDIYKAMLDAAPLPPTDEATNGVR